MKSWLQLYADEIKWLKENYRAIDSTEATASSKTMMKAYPSRHSITPLLKSTWNQGAPYNNKCPIYYNKDGSTGTAATGCVATALAQVINYYKYPNALLAPIPSLTNNYTTDSGTKQVTCKAIYKNTPIDWANMLDNYTGSETEDQKNAVANLMLMCGQAVKMGYGASSGASFGDNVATMFKSYFGYDDKVYAAYRSKYSSSDWSNLIYNEIANGHPVAYDGFSTGGGHAFVIDGFDGDELFHLNWGWGGGSDGYFLLSILNPGDNTGAGASTSSDGYSMGQTAIIGVDYPDQVVNESTTALTVNNVSAASNRVQANFINRTRSNNTFDATIVMKDANDVCVPVSTIKSSQAIAANTSYSWTFNVGGMIKTPGIYRLSPATKLSSNSIWRPSMNMYNEYVEVVVDEAGATTSVKYHTPQPEISIFNWEFPGNLASGTQQEVKVTYNNKGDEFYKEVELLASQTNNQTGTNCRGQVILKTNETDTYSYYFTPDAIGTWNLWLKADGNIIGQTTVDIIDPAKVKPANLHVNDFSITNGAYGNCLVGTVSIKNNALEAFNGRIKLQLWVQDTNGSNNCWSAGSSTSELNVAAGGTTSAPFNFTNLQVGRNYFISVDYTNQSGSLDNGGLVWGHNWELKPGVLCWNTVGGVTGQAAGSTLAFTTSYAGALIDGMSINSATPCQNKNMVYAFTNTTTIPTGLEGYNVVSADSAQTITIVDGTPFYSPVNFTADKATFSHTFSLVSDGIKGWEAITLPFKPNSITIDGNEVTWKKGDSTGDFWLREFSEINDSNEVVFSDVKDITSLRGYTPYIIGVPENLAGKTIVFTGTKAAFNNTGNDKMVVGSDSYLYYGTTVTKRVTEGYVLNLAGDAYEYATTTKSVKPFDNYFTTKLSSDSRPASIKIAGTIPSGITTPFVNDNNSNTIYNIQGVKVTSPTKGIYIKNGKKYIK